MEEEEKRLNKTLGLKIPWWALVTIWGEEGRGNELEEEIRGPTKEARMEGDKGKVGWPHAGPAKEE